MMSFSKLLFPTFYFMISIIIHYLIHLQDIGNRHIIRIVNTTTHLSRFVKWSCSIILLFPWVINWSGNRAFMSINIWTKWTIIVARFYCHCCIVRLVTWITYCSWIWNIIVRVSDIFSITLCTFYWNSLRICFLN